MKKRFFAMVMTLAMLFTTICPLTVTAAELPTEVPELEKVVTGEIPITREQIAELFNVSLEELGDCTLYAATFDAENSQESMNVIQIPADGNAVEVDEFISMTGGTHRGKSFQIQGNRIAWILGCTNMSNNLVKVSATLYAEGSAMGQASLQAGNKDKVTTGFMNATPRTTFYIQYTMPDGDSGSVFSLILSTNS